MRSFIQLQTLATDMNYAFNNSAKMTEAHKDRQSKPNMNYHSFKNIFFAQTSPLALTNRPSTLVSSR